MASHGSGWLIITDGDDTWKLEVGEWEYSVSAEPDIDQLPGDNRISIELMVRKRTVKAKEIHFRSLSDINTFLKDMDDWNRSGGFSLKIQCNTDEDYLDFGAAGDEIDVLYKDIAPVTKVGRGNVQHYIIKLITFLEA